MNINQLKAKLVKHASLKKVADTYMGGVNVSKTQPKLNTPIATKSPTYSNDPVVQHLTTLNSQAAKTGKPVNWQAPKTQQILKNNPAYKNHSTVNKKPMQPKYYYNNNYKPGSKEYKAYKDQHNNYLKQHSLSQEDYNDWHTINGIGIKRPYYNAPNLTADENDFNTLNNLPKSFFDNPGKEDELPRFDKINDFQTAMRSGKTYYDKETGSTYYSPDFPKVWDPKVKSHKTI